MTRALHFFGSFLAETTVLVLCILLALVASPVWLPVLLWRRRSGAVFVTALLALSATGCGASALDKTERAYGVLHAAQAETVARFEGGLREAVREACPSGEDACALAVAEQHRAAEAGLALSADALDAAGRELVAWASRGDADALPPSTCARVAAAVDALGHALTLVRALGVDLPAFGLPTWTCGGEQ